MANLVSGNLPPPEGMSYEQFSEYALYLTLREFLRLHQGQQAMLDLDERYKDGFKINAEALIRTPMGKTIAALGRAMHEGAVLFGWDNKNGVMDWARYCAVARWFARLNRQQQMIAIARIRSGSEEPWVSPNAQPKPPVSESGMVITANPSVPGGTVGQQDSGAPSQESTDLTRRVAADALARAEGSDGSGIGIAGWLAIIAAVVGIGVLIYKLFDAKNPQQQPEQPEASS